MVAGEYNRSAFQIKPDEQFANEARETCQYLLCLRHVLLVAHLVSNEVFVKREPVFRSDASKHFRRLFLGSYGNVHASFDQDAISKVHENSRAVFQVCDISKSHSRGFDCGCGG